MPVIDKFATSLGLRDEVPNQELAREIVAGCWRRSGLDWFAWTQRQGSQERQY